MFSQIRYWIGPLGLLATLIMLLGGCAGAVPVPSNQTSAVAEGPRHDLAVISLDLDPPLRVLEINAAKPNITLLAAIDNKGTFTEKQVTVVATLRSSLDGELLVERCEVVASLAPGQATIVRFGSFPSIPARDSYTLAVNVAPAPGETNLANNSKSIPLQMVISH